MNCSEASRLIGPFVDDELDVKSVLDVEGHLLRCGACAQEKNELMGLRETARERLPRFDPPAGLEDRIFAAPARQRPALRRRLPWRQAALVAAAACATLVATTALRPARDFTAQGFALAGGRLEMISGHPAAALVYRRRQHVLNLFLSPASKDEPRRDFSLRGYRVSTWTQEGLRYRLVSDVAPSESDELVSLVRGGDARR